MSASFVFKYEHRNPVVISISSHYRSLLKLYTSLLIKIITSAVTVIVDVNRFLTPYTFFILIKDYSPNIHPQ